MNMKNYIILIICVSIFCLIPVFKSEALFDQSGKSARIESMAGISILAQGSDAVFLNPAGISQKNEFDIGFTYSSLYKDLGMSKNSASMVVPLSVVNIGFGWFNFDAGIYSENTFIFSSAKQIIDSLSIGLNYKFLMQKVNLPEMQTAGLKDSVYGHAIDIGFIYSIRSQIILGLSGINLLSSNLAREGTEYASRTIDIGGAYVYKPKMIPFFNHIMVSLGLSVMEDYKDKYQPKLGLETKTLLGKVAFFLRMGMTSDNFSCGSGFNFFNTRIDYSFVYNSKMREIGQTHLVSIGYTY